MRRLAVWIGGVGAGLLLLLLLAAGWLAGTESGLRWVLGRTAESGLVVSQVEGRLLGRIALHGVRYEGDGMMVTVAHVDMHWSLWQLLRRQVEVERLYIEDVLVQLPEPEPAEPEPERPVPTEPTVPPRYSTPIGLALRSLELRNLQVVPHGGDTLRISNVAGSAVVVGSSLVVALDWAGQMPNGLELAGKLSVDGKLDDARIQHRLEQPTQAVLSARIRRVLEPELDWEAQLVVDETRLEELLPDAEPLTFQATVSAAGKLDAMTARIGMAGQHAETGPVELDAVAALEGQRLVLDSAVVRMAAGPVLRLHGSADLDAGPQLDLVASWTGLSWPLEQPAVSSPRGRLQVSGSAAAFDARLTARIEGEDLPGGEWQIRANGGFVEELLRVTLRLDGAADGMNPLTGHAMARYHMATGAIRLERAEFAVTETGAWLAATGEARLTEAGIDGQAAVEWRSIQWRLEDGRLLVSPEGQLALGATGERIDLQGEFITEGTDIPPAAWRLSGAGTAEEFALESLYGEILGGSIQATAELSRSGNQLDWTATLSGAGLDPGTVLADWPGDLHMDLAASGRLAPDYMTIYLARLAMDGALRERPIEAQARGELHGTSFRLDTLYVRTGAAELTAAGQVADDVSLALALHAPDLTDLAPGVSGSARLRLTATGEPATPSLEMEMDARELGFGDGEALLDSLRIVTRGSEAQHQLNVEARLAELRLELGLAGGHRDGIWTGEIRTLDLITDRAGGWNLERPAELSAAATGVQLEPVCLAGAGRLCTRAEWSPEAGTGWSVSGNDIPLALLAMGMPPEANIEGVLTIAGTGHIRPGDAVPTGQLRVASDGGALLLTRQVGEDFRQPFEGFELTASSDAAALAAGFEVRLGALGQIAGSIHSPVTGPLQARPLHGEIRGEIRDDGTLARNLDAITTSAGNLRLALRLGGTASSPEILGNVLLDSAALFIEELGLWLHDGYLAMQDEDGGRWRLDGGIASGAGQLRLSGVATLPHGGSDWTADLDVRGQDFGVIRNEMAEAAISPTLRIEASPAGVHASGNLLVPRARLTVQEVELPVAPSPDVVIVGAETAAEATAPPALPLHANIRAVLGDDVKLDAMGLRGRLAGAVTVNATPDRPPVGTGELRVEDGSYRIYRQTFAIERGRLIYSGSPLDDPALDLRITRRGPEVVSGVTVEGSVSEPQVHLFSEPPLSDDEILAYLLIGRPLNRLSRAEGDMVRNMAESAGVAGGNLVLARLSNLFGLNEAHLQRETGGARQTSLVLGRQLLPRVHVGYAIPLADAPAVLRIRYFIGRGFTLQTESGAETGADLLYTIER